MSKYRCDIVVDYVPGIRRKWTGVGSGGQDFYENATLDHVVEYLEGQDTDSANEALRIIKEEPSAYVSVDLVDTNRSRVVGCRVLKYKDFGAPSPTFMTKEQRDIEDLKKRLDSIEGGMMIPKSPVNESPTDNERRIRVLRVPYNVVLQSVLVRGNDLPRTLHILRVGVPEESEVLSVREDFFSRSFEFLIRHPSFSPVPDGEQAPVIKSAYSYNIETVPNTDV